MVLLTIRGETVPFVDGLSEEAYNNVKLNMESMEEEEFRALVLKLKGTSQQTPTIKERKPTKQELRNHDPLNMELWTVKQLRSFAKGRHIPEYWKLSKTELLGHLRN